MKVGETLGHYKIIEKIGVGGMGKVYLAEDTKLDRKAAVKVLSRRYSRNSKKLKRFIREAKAASALNHPNIVTVYDFGEADGARYIALEHIEGETLNEFLRQPRTLDAVLDIAVQIASALDAAHAAGIVHRDIKPDNIMIRPDGFVKILDFGIAKLISDPGLRSAELNQEGTTLIQNDPKSKIQNPKFELTLPGMVIGTANYMSPEQAGGKEIDARTDIFSFGVILYKMLAGYLPFEGETQMEVIAAIINQEPKPLTGADIPPEIKRIIFRALRKERDERYLTIRELLTDIKKFRKQIEHHGQTVTTAVSNRENAGTRILNAVTVDEPAETADEPAVTIDENRKTSEDVGKEDHITIKKTRLVKILAGIIAVLLIAAAAGWGYRFLFPGPPGQVGSVAVMPFAVEDGQKDLEILADGMTEHLIERLSKIQRLEVRASRAVFAYKEKDRTPRQLGHELRAEALLFGKVGRRGADLILRLELVDTRSVSILWSKSYERRADDLVSLENDVGADVTEELRSRLRRPAERRPAGNRSDTP